MTDRDETLEARLVDAQCDLRAARHDAKCWQERGERAEAERALTGVDLAEARAEAAALRRVQGLCSTACCSAVTYMLAAVEVAEAAAGCICETVIPCEMCVRREAALARLCELKEVGDG